jgi:hypothetical protein
MTSVQSIIPSHPVSSLEFPGRLRFKLASFIRRASELYGHWYTVRLLSHLEPRQLEDIGIPHDQTPTSSGTLDRYPRIIKIRRGTI